MGRVVEAQPCKHFMTATACMPVDAAAHSLPVALALPQMYACIYILQAFLLALSQSTFRGVWAATVVWLCLLLLLEVLVVGTAPLWLYTPGGSSSMHSLPWSIWVAMVSNRSCSCPESCILHPG